MAEILFISGGGGGAAVTDHFAPRVIVGNTVNGDPAVAQVAPFRYIPDPGDGTGIQLALNEAGALPTGGDVFARAGAYTLGAPLTIPANVRLCGAGAATLITGEDTGVIFNGDNIEVEHLRFGGFTDAVQAGVGSSGSIRQCRFENCASVDLQTSTNCQVAHNHLGGATVESGLATNPDVSNNLP